MNQKRFFFTSSFFIRGLASLLLLTVLLPLFFMLFAELFHFKELLQQFQILLRSPYWFYRFIHTVFLASSIVLLSLVIGIFAGFSFTKFNLKFSSFFLLLHSLPLFLPPFLAALGSFYLFGKQGFLGTTTTSHLLFSSFGAIFILGFAFAPVVTWLLILGLRSIDPAIEESAYISVPLPRLFLKILLPLVRPHLFFASIIVFVLAFSELGVFMFLRLKTYPAMIFSRLGTMYFAQGEAFALSLPLFLLLFLLLFLERKFALTPLLKTRTTTLINNIRYSLTPNTLIFLYFSNILLMSISSAPFLALLFKADFSSLSQLRIWVDESLFNSFFIAFFASFFILILSLSIGHALARKINSFYLLEILAFSTFMLPSSIFAMSFIFAWNRPISSFIYRSVLILVIALIARYAILGIRASTILFQSTHEEFEQAASIFGASYGRSFFRVVLPMHWRQILLIGLLIFLFTLRDLDTIISFYPPSWATLPVRIFTLEANGSPQLIATLAAIHLIATFSLLLFAQFFHHFRQSS